MSRGPIVAWTLAALGALVGAATLVPANSTPVDTGEGLIITELARGSGRACTTRDRIEIEFTARIRATGEVFDSTIMRRRTWELDLSAPGLIEGLRRGIVGMRAGSWRRIEVPWTLGYGENGRPPIPPRADLVYDVRVVSIL